MMPGYAYVYASMYTTYIFLTLFCYSTLFAKMNSADLKATINYILPDRKVSYFQFTTELVVSNIKFKIIILSSSLFCFIQERKKLDHFVVFSSNNIVATFKNKNE